MDSDIYAVRKLLAEVRKHDNYCDHAESIEYDPALNCMVSFRKELLEAGKALVRIEARLKNGNT